jgi:hypothetical protein
MRVQELVTELTKTANKPVVPAIAPLWSPVLLVGALVTTLVLTYRRMPQTATAPIANNHAIQPSSDPRRQFRQRRPASRQ